MTAQGKRVSADSDRRGPTLSIPLMGGGKIRRRKRLPSRWPSCHFGKKRFLQWSGGKEAKKGGVDSQGTSELGGEVL